MFLAACEHEFKDVADEYDIEFLQRTTKSAMSEHSYEILGYLREFSGQRVCLLSGCNPFLKAETVFEFISKSKNHKSFAMVKDSVDVIFDCDNRIINKDIGCFNSKERKPNHIISNSGYVFDIDSFFTRGVIWDYTNDNPALFTIDCIEAVDIDTELDFAIAQAIAQHKAI